MGNHLLFLIGGLFLNGWWMSFCSWKCLYMEISGKHSFQNRRQDSGSPTPCFRDHVPKLGPLLRPVCSWNGGISWFLGFFTFCPIFGNTQLSNCRLFGVVSGCLNIGHPEVLWLTISLPSQIASWACLISRQTLVMPMMWQKPWWLRFKNLMLSWSF